VTLASWPGSMNTRLVSRPRSRTRSPHSFCARAFSAHCRAGPRRRQPRAGVNDRPRTIAPRRTSRRGDRVALHDHAAQRWRAQEGLLPARTGLVRQRFPGSCDAMADAELGSACSPKSQIAAASATSRMDRRGHEIVRNASPSPEDTLSHRRFRRG
jgi:hypothetical protein